MYTKPPRILPQSRDGLAFELQDLQAAMAWAGKIPGMRLYIRLDCLCITEAMEISPPGRSSPRWFIWRTHEGRLRVDDWGRNAFGLPYRTVGMALQYITTQL